MGLASFLPGLLAQQQQQQQQPWPEE
jgi:hypothetical protein